MKNWNTCHILRYKVQAICTSGSCKDSSSIFLNCLHFTQSSSTSCVSMSLPFAWSSVKCIVNCNSSHAALFLKRWKYSLKLYQILMSRIMCSKLTACFCSITQLKKIGRFKFRTFCISDKFQILWRNIARVNLHVYKTWIGRVIKLIFITFSVM